MTKITLLTYSELMELGNQERRVLKEGIDAGTKTWGRWSYNATEDIPAVSLNNMYEIELSRIDTTAELGDWLLHLAEKGWVTSDDLGNLVVAIRDLETAGFHRVRR